MAFTASSQAVRNALPPASNRSRMKIGRVSLRNMTSWTASRSATGRVGPGLRTVIRASRRERDRDRQHGRRGQDQQTSTYERSCQHLLDRLGLGVDDPDRPADAGVVLRHGVDPQPLADRGQEVGDRRPGGP